MSGDRVRLLLGRAPGLAPVELAICLFLVWTGPGMWARGRRFAPLGPGAG
jgi:hypothetical protein